MAKKDYQTPGWKLLTFETEDVLTASDELGFDDGVGVNGSTLWGENA